MTLKLGMLYRVLKYYQVRSNYDPGLTLTYFTARSNLVPNAFVWEKGKPMDFSETIVVYDVKVGICNKRNNYMNLYEYQRSRLFIDLGLRSLRFNMWRLHGMGEQICSAGPSHMTKMAVLNLNIHTPYFSHVWINRASVTDFERICHTRVTYTFHTSFKGSMNANSSHCS